MAYKEVKLVRILEITCDKCGRKFYVDDKVGRDPERCCWCGSDDIFHDFTHTMSFKASDQTEHSELDTEIEPDPIIP